jgi:AraC-like DNA-binding protein
MIDCAASRLLARRPAKHPRVELTGQNLFVPNPNHDVAIDQLFAGLPNVMFCRKGVDGRYVGANDAFVRRTGRRNLIEVLGCTASDLFSEELAASYEAQDRAVVHTGRAVQNQLEIIADRDGGHDWFLTNKSLQHDILGVPEAILVVSVEVLISAQGDHDAGLGLRNAIEFAQRSFANSPMVEDMAKAAGLSAAQLDRAMHKALGVSPKQYLQRVRVEQASTFLATTSMSLSEIAVACGYYDQSQFTRHFHSMIGMTPARYRSG